MTSSHKHRITAAQRKANRRAFLLKMTPAQRDMYMTMLRAARGETPKEEA